MARNLVVCMILLLPSLAPLQAQRSDAPEDAPKAPPTPRDPSQFANSLGIRFVRINPGTFLMGSPKDEKNRNVLETQHSVKLTKGFYLAAYPVTQDQWVQVMAGEYARPVEGFDIVVPSRFAGQKKLPVETVSWNDCQAFIAKLNRKERRNYRLPTEAEWEYACRAGTTSMYNVGDTLSTSQANFGAALGLGKRKGTAPVGSYPPNAWGLYDMHGNVAQWCQDRFGRYPQTAVVDPQGADKGGNRSVRGGSWEDAAARCRSAARGSESADDRGLGTVGFRLCLPMD